MVNAIRSTAFAAAVSLYACAFAEAPKMEAVFTLPGGRTEMRPVVAETFVAAAGVLPVVDISADSSRQVVIAEGTKDRYEGHPSTLLGEDGRTLFCVWTTGHGGPCGPMAVSSDGGQTWCRVDSRLPEVYGRTHRNCPVLQKLKGPDGKVRFFIYSAKAKEGRGLGIMMSEDEGETWAELPCQPQLSAGMPPTGVMELKDGTIALFGQVFKDKAKAKDRPTDDQAVWMAISKDGGRTYGEMRQVMRAEGRNLCEPCCLRSPDGKSLLLIARENRHAGHSMMSFSDDEGRSWTTPADTPWALTGDRHEGVLLPDGRYLIAFRDQALGSPTRGQFTAWVGTFDDLRNGRDGQCRIRLLKHHGRKGIWPGNPIDTGYPGVELLTDGMIVCTTYSRHFDDDRQSSVVCTRFKIDEIDGLCAASRGKQVRGKPGSVPKDFRFAVDRSEEVVENSGVPPEEMDYLLDRLERETADRPFVVTRTRWLTAIFDNTRLAVKPDDVFVDWFRDWKNLDKRRKLRVKAFKEAHPEIRRAFGGACLDASHTCPDWESILALGPKGLADRARERRKTAATDEERLFLDCVVELYEAMTRLCVRWADVATAAGAKACASTLREIAAHPPRTLREALQLMLVYDRCQEAEGECVRSQGLFDRLYIRYYRDDLATGRETPASAKALVRALFDKIRDQAHPNGKNFAFGGYGRDGAPVWNELTEMAFDLQYELNRVNPKFTFRYGKKTPREQLKRVARNLAAGRTGVVFLNEETSREMFVRRGKDPADTADAVLVGCYEPAIQGREVIASMSVQLNLAKPLEAALNGGKAFSGKRIGPACALPRTAAEFEQEYLRQLRTMISKSLQDERVYVANWQDLNPSPFLSGAFRDAVSAARDCHDGSMKYSQSGVMLGGLGTAADSLAAVRWLLEEDRSVTMDELAAILKDDWKGHEELRLRVRRLAPKWGNNDDRADAPARRIAEAVTSLVNKAPNGRGGTFQAGLWSIDNDIHFGKVTEATPDGRRKGERLSRNNGATAGCGRGGPTALLLSCAKIDQADCPDGFILDVILPVTASPDGGAEDRLVAFLDVFRENGGQCVHLNCFNAETLRDAQRHPERYPDLQVRICGWNVRWNDLTKADQDHFIATAEAQE